MFIPHLTIVSKQSWHYRLVSGLNKLFNEPKPESVCKYWCVELPGSLMFVAIYGAFALFIVLGLLALIGLGVWEAVYHPMKALADVGYIMALAAAVALIIGLCVWGEKFVKRHCPPLTIHD